MESIEVLEERLKRALGHQSACPTGDEKAAWGVHNAYYELEDAKLIVEKEEAERLKAERIKEASKPKPKEAIPEVKTPKKVSKSDLNIEEKTVQKATPKKKTEVFGED